MKKIKKELWIRIQEPDKKRGSGSRDSKKADPDLKPWLTYKRSYLDILFFVLVLYGPSLPVLLVRHDEVLGGEGV